MNGLSLDANSVPRTTRITVTGSDGVIAEQSATILETDWFDVSQNLIDAFAAMGVEVVVSFKIL